MFASHKKNPSAKSFQKPNILRKRPKVASAPILATTMEPDTIVFSNSESKPDKSKEINHTIIISGNEQQPRIGMKCLQIDNNLCSTQDIKTSQESNFTANTNLDMQAIESYDIIISESDDDQDSVQNELNIDAFINGGALQQSVSQTNVNTKSHTQQQSQPAWCLNLLASDVIIEGYNSAELCEGEQHVIIDTVPSAVAPTDNIVMESQNNLLEVPVTATQTKAVDCFTNRAIKFKCDEPDCNKGFWSEERLYKHQNSHKRQARLRTGAPAVKIECPVQKLNAEGAEVKCDRRFDARPDLLKHLNTDHTPEDASYGCELCGRRFFWALGLRAHAVWCARAGAGTGASTGTGAGTGALACGWPGCARVFRLPCRLREHARAHTGDRPYLCRFPDCGWAFRSNSKLVRHARRHTGERRHACGACGRAFLRREHLRDHARRHHAPHARARHACPHQGCEQSFTNMSSLYMHMKKVHRKQQENVAAVAEDASCAPAEPDDHVYLLSLVPATLSEECSVEEPAEEYVVASIVEGDVAGGDGGGAGPGGEGRAARTHCTWPLQRALADDDAHTGDGGDTGAEYSVRSDLFLHSNTPLDEDSTNIGGAEIATAAPLDADLCLIDPHPTIDLMQEELMYDDAAVDETSFRREFLLNGDELT